MALEDCIAKFKGKITGDQIAALEAAKDEGLTDEQAVRRVLLAAQVNVIDIADRARKQGAKLAPVPNPVSDVAKFQAATLEKIKAEREALTAENAKLKEELSDIETVRAGVKRESGVGPGLSEQELQEIDLTKPQELTGLSNLLFRNKEGLKRGVFGLKGSTPLELAASYDKLLAREPEIAARQAEIAKEIDALDARVSKVFSGTGKQTFFQDKARAEITFNEQNQAIIRLTEAKDLTSFLHEGAHLYLEMLGDLVERPDANAGMVEDYKKILKYLGVSSREEIGADQHELFARSFEAYLREGIAPTAELQPLFSDFKGWFTLVYKKITQLLGVTESLSDDIRGVFDRLVASDEAISQSEDMMQYVQLFQNAEEMGISQEAFDVYKLNMQRSHQDAVDIESAKMIRAMKWSEQQWWNDERDKIAVDVRKKAEAMPVYRALAMLQNGKRPDGSDTGMSPFKLNRDDLIKRYGKDFIKRLPGRGANVVYRIEGGVDADVAAMVFGFESGDAMIKAMVASRPMEAWIRAEANRIMRENHPDPKNSPELFNDATKAVHNQKRGRILAAELNALRRKQREDAKIVRATKSQIKREDKQAREANKGQIPTRENLALVKAAARHVIGKKRIRDVNPNTYLQAERKAGRLAFEAMGKKDYAEAYYQKLVQIRNFEAYRAAVAAKKSWESTQRYLKSFEKLPKRRRMGKAGKLDQIDAVMEGIDLRKLSLTRIDREKIENELSEAIKAGRIVTTPEIAAMLKNPGGTNWKDLTVETFAGIRDVVKQLEHQARTDLKAIVNGEEVILKEARDEVAGSIIANNGKVMIPRGEGDFWKDTKRNGRQALGQWLRHGTMARVLDKADFGAVTRRIVVPIRRAYTEKLLPRLEKAAEDVAAIYKKHYTNDELIQLGKPLSEKTMGEYMSKADILSLALNWGSESNRAAVLGGMMKDEYGNKTPAYTHAGVAQALARLDARDWAFVQDVWDYQNSYWPEMAETEKRRRGIAPQKIEALPFTIRTSDGQEVSVRGGYMHLQYNPEHGGHVSQNEIDEIGDKIKHGGFVTAGTRAGATYERTEAKHGRVVRLSLNTIDQNLREIIRDITIGDEISFANNILQSNEVNNAARNTNNSEALKSLQLWLTDAAVGELPANNSIEKALGWIRVGFTKSKLAFNVYVTALQLTGIFQSIAVLGLKNFSIGFGKFASSPAANYKW